MSFEHWLVSLGIGRKYASFVISASAQSRYNAHCHPERSEGPFRTSKGPSAFGLGMTVLLTAEANMAEPVQIGILLYPQVTQLDATGPAQVCAACPAPPCT